jgi:uncharacterized delta-60 repeat protein
MFVWRYDPDGSPDNSFDVNGKVSFPVDPADESDAYGGSIAIDGQGRVLVAGLNSQYVSGSSTNFYHAGFWRYDSHGNLDQFYFDNGYDGTSIAVDSHGNILVAGRIGNQNGYDDVAVWRYKSDGSLDTTFGTNGVAVYDSGNYDHVESMVIDSQGGILVTGYIPSAGNDMFVCRFDSSGTLDASFGTGGVRIYDYAGKEDWGKSITTDSQGRILVTGFVDNGTSTSYEMAIWRYSSSGSPDTTFGANGNGVVLYDGGVGHDIGNAITIDSQGRVLVAGYLIEGIKNVYENHYIAVWRYLP